MTDSVLSVLLGPADDIDSVPQKVADHFSQLYQDVTQIPLLSVHNPPEAFPHRALVAFRALVQDTSPSPEIYLARRPNGHCGGWGIADTRDISDNVNYSDLREITVIWAVSIPGESPWCSAEGLAHLSHNPPRPHKYPLPGSPHIGVQVKIYDPRLAQGLKASDICTFVGILTKEPLYSEDLDSSESIDLVPTLHVLFTRKTPPTITPRNFPIEPSLPNLRATRDKLVTWIAKEALDGDKDAAKWVLLSAIAKTQSRTPPIYPPSLTLSSFPAPSDPSATPTLYHVLSLILPIINILPLTLGTLNKTSFSPESKNEDLHSGWLQVPHGSLYLLTETGVMEGIVLDKGIQNLRAVQGAITGQTLDYIFPFSRFTFQTDISFVILTGGKKSAFFQTSVNVPLDSGRDYDFYKPLDKINLPEGDLLDHWRNLVGGSKIGTVTINDEVAQYIQDDFVKERKATGSGDKDLAITSDDLIRCMMTARLLALSYHESLVTKDVWEEAKALEARRKARS
ncbi:hypothetical protein P691DRAFT_803108 [Macrolepiota fuliginosa MF-IS2]|uniref:Mini-chromosome maintenance complex-binding protein n=1 Tax=Macrolepiota fuliginosa MF-IS2 TaxID=1400762 RepID=A0A9P6C8D5_9AGAR|nr:hypothetical protein P691DRAFT_803108 [Macrolepiota fuliginosa MF-IS2]